MVESSDLTERHAATSHVQLKRLDSDTLRIEYKRDNASAYIDVYADLLERHPDLVDRLAVVVAGYACEKAAEDSSQ